MTSVNTKINLSRHDDLYQEIVELFDGESDEDSRKICAKLVLLLANHIGDASVIREAIAIARS